MFRCLCMSSVLCLCVLVGLFLMWMMMLVWFGVFLISLGFRFILVSRFMMCFVVECFFGFELLL